MRGTGRILIAAQMRALEGRAMRQGGLSGRTLMERAGEQVVAAALHHWPVLAGRPGRACVLCGPGNNGGDGFVVARLLAGRGWEVAVFLMGDPDRLPADARANHDAWMRSGGVAPLDRFDAREGEFDLHVDALFGTGLTRPLSGAALAAVAGLAALPSDARRVAVDAPSGLCLDSGRMLGEAPPRWAADLTVTFDTPKAGHFLAEGPGRCGALQVRDIGISGWHDPADNPLRLVQGNGAADLLTKAGPADHKFAHGHALVLTGGPGRTGAARLAARAALRIGAGLVTLGVPPSAQSEVAAQVTALMLCRVPDADALAAVLDDPRINALCLGPALGTDARAAGLVRAALECGAGRPLVLDADALTLLAGDPDLAAQLHAGCVLTPHAGEFRRLFPDLAARLAAPAMHGPAWSRVDAARAAADRAGCTVLLKGPDTVIAGPDGAAAIHSAAYERAAPWLATAGAGDVLAGLIAGLLARGLAPMDAATTGAWLHVEAARRFGPGLIAEDLPEQVPGVLRDLGL